MRQLFGKPIRKQTTLEFFPYQFDIEEFRCFIIDNFAGFQKNMQDLGGKVIEPKKIEEWVEQYLAWLEIEQEPDDGK